MKNKTQSFKNADETRLTPNFKRINTAKYNEKYSKINKDILTLFDESTNKDCQYNF